MGVCASRRDAQRAGGQVLKWADRFALTLFAICVLYLLWQIVEAQGKPLMRTVTVNNVLSEIYHSPYILMTKTDAWRYMDNTQVPPKVEIWTVPSVYRSAGFETETIAEFDARHAAKVEAERLLYPPLAN